MNRGVALVNALIVVAALAALAAALLLRAGQAQERLALKFAADQAAAYLDAGQAQALAELARLLEAGAPVRPGQGWDQPRDLAIGRGRVGWALADLHGRFNLAWLAYEGAPGDLARAAFLRLAEGQGLPLALAERLLRAAGPDPIQRASALGTGAAPDLPLLTPLQLAPVPRPDEGGAAALAPLWPLLAALPPEAGLNPNTASLAVMQALVPGLAPADWEEFQAVRDAGAFADPGGLLAHAAEHWPETALAALVSLPLDTAPAWFALELRAELDSLVLRRSAVVALVSPGDPALIAPRVVLSLPIVE